MAQGGDSGADGRPTAPRQEYLEIRGPTGAVQRLGLTGRKIAFGRAPDAQVRLPSETVSHYHAELFCDDFGRWWIHDLGSHNGTRVNGQRITESVLRNGDTVGMGAFALRFFQPPAAAGETTASDPQNSVLISSAQSGPIASLAEGAVPKVAASHLSSLIAFGRQLVGVQDAGERLRGLCRLMVGDEFGGWSAMVIRLCMDRPADPPRVICGPEARPEHRAWKPYVSGTLLQAVRQRRELLLASNAAEAPVDVQLSLPQSETALSALACPLSSGPQQMDFLYVVLPPEYGTREWLAMASLAVDAFQHAEASWVAYEQAKTNALIEQELAHAREIQMRLVPQAVSVLGWDVALEFEPCRWVGGDYVDVVPMPDGRTLLAVADVCGKGLHAALVAATVHSLVRACVQIGAGLTDLMTVLNGYLCEYIASGSFVTMLAVVVDPHGGRVECINAGHPPLMIISPRGEVRRCDAGGHTPLGLWPMAIQSAPDQVPDGHLMAMYTDGLTDMSSVSGKMVGLNRLGEQMGAACVSASGDGPTARQVADRLKAFIRETLGGQLPADDSTFLLARRLP
jgi:sigma-B regulation protein RsbU (phosphoserine phosphatase)